MPPLANHLLLLRAGIRYIALTSEPSGQYNCVAWAAGRTDQWWWPCGGWYWPGKARNEERAPTPDEFVTTFSRFGYAVTTNRTLEAGVDKIAFYGRNRDVKHAARQLPNGHWTSKCGQQADIEHTLDQIEQAYGPVLVVMRRDR